MCFLTNLICFIKYGKTYILNIYSKNSVDKNRKIIIPIIKKMLKLLINKKNKPKVLTESKSTTQIFKAFKKKAKKSKERKSFWKGDRKNCIYYLSHNHDSFLC